MKRTFEVHTAVVGSLAEYREKLSRAAGGPPPVLASLRDLFPGLRPVGTLRGLVGAATLPTRP